MTYTLVATRQGVPGNGQLTSNEQLITILTTIIYTCSVSHASTNFPQYEEYGFPPNYPGLLRGQPPTTKVSSVHSVCVCVCVFVCVCVCVCESVCV